MPSPPSSPLHSRLPERWSMTIERGAVMEGTFTYRAQPAGFALVARVASLLSTAFAVVLFSFAFPGTAVADCVCQCVNGELAAICSGNISVQPTCAPRSCPAPDSSLSTARNQLVSSRGGNGSDCAPRQVLDPISGKYEWQVLCR